jgi:cytoskeletal protein CcmA (bactofilin family)
MWKKDDDPEATTSVPTPTGSTAPSKPRASQPQAGREQATIGRSITIRGDVTGDEDLLIQGRVEGTVDLKQHNVTVGPEGRVKADLKGRMVTIEGEVDGDVRGQEQVALRASSKVNGDIVAPRVVLEDGASFLGSIDMSGKAPGAAGNTPSPAPPKTPKPAEPPKPSIAHTGAATS